MMLNVLNGTLDIGIGEIQELRSQLDAGKITLLATFNPERIAEKPDVPTVKELGYDVSLVKFRGLAGPKGVPEVDNSDLGRSREEACWRIRTTRRPIRPKCSSPSSSGTRTIRRSSTTSARRPKHSSSRQAPSSDGGERGRPRVPVPCQAFTGKG